MTRARAPEKVHHDCPRDVHGVGIHAYLFGQLFAQCRTAYINTHAALLMVDMLGSIPKGSHCNTSHLYCPGCTLQIMYHENTRLGESSISRHKARSGGFGTFSLECGADIQPGTSWALAALDRPSNGRIADLSAKVKWTDSDTRCHVGSSLTQQISGAHPG